MTPFSELLRNKNEPFHAKHTRSRGHNDRHTTTDFLTRAMDGLGCCGNNCTVDEMHGENREAEKSKETEKNKGDKGKKEERREGQTCRGVPAMTFVRMTLDRYFHIRQMPGEVR